MILNKEHDDGVSDVSGKKWDINYIFRENIMKTYKITIEELKVNEERKYEGSVTIYEQRIELAEGTGATDKIKSIIESVNKL